jgi:hypothetical protein
VGQVKEKKGRSFGVGLRSRNEKRFVAYVVDFGVAN